MITIQFGFTGHVIYIRFFMQDTCLKRFLTGNWGTEDEEKKWTIMMLLITVWEHMFSYW
jgi:hypothetical protein